MGALKSCRNAIDALAGEAGDEVELPQIDLLSESTSYGVTTGTFIGTIPMSVQAKKTGHRPVFLIVLFDQSYSAAAATTGPSTSCTNAIGAASPGRGPSLRIRR